jgi:hypothetical protein
MNGSGVKARANAATDSSGRQKGARREDRMRRRAIAFSLSAAVGFLALVGVAVRSTSTC